MYYRTFIGDNYILLLRQRVLVDSEIFVSLYHTELLISILQGASHPSWIYKTQDQCAFMALHPKRLQMLAAVPILHSPTWPNISILKNSLLIVSLIPCPGLNWLGCVAPEKVVSKEPEELS